MASITSTKAVDLKVNKINKANYDSMRTAGTITDTMAADELWMGDGRLVSDSDLTAHTGDSNIHTTAAEKAKLSGIAAGANNYTHPSSHPPSIITQDASNRFVTDTEKATWNAKETTAGAQAKVDSHIAVKTNPHGVTKAQVGLGSVNDYSIATQAEAEAGVSDAKYMTPLSTKQAITKAAPVNATTSVSGLMSNTDKAKLDGVAAGANNYIHPSSHPPSIITQDASNRFMTDAEKTKLSGIAAEANNYTHPSSHPPSIITQDASNRFVTDAEKAAWNAKSDASSVYTKSETDTRIQSIVNAAPAALDTLKEIGDALNNDPNFASTVTTELSKKVDKVNGKDLSTNDYTTEEKTKLSGIATGATLVAKSATNGNITINGIQQTVYTHPAGTNPHATTKTDVGLGNVDNTSDTNKPVSTAAQAALDLKADKTQVLTNVPVGAKFTDTVYTHPSTHPPSIIAQDASNRFMTDAERTKLTGIATGATNTQNHATNGSISVNGAQQVVYAHPTADGDKHVPVTGTTNNGKVLKAGATAGSLSWSTLTASEVGAVPTTRTVNGKALSADISITASDVSAYSKTEIDGKIVDNLTTGGATSMLSAEQGKVLNSAIGQNSSKITALEGKINAPSYSAPTDATAPIISLPSTAIKGKLDGSIKGNTLYQAVVNGDFSNGHAGWYADATTKSVLNKILSVTIKEEYNFTMASNVTNIDMIDSKKVFLKIRTRVTNPNCNRLRMFYNGSNNSSLAQLSVVATQSAPVSNQWYDLIGIATISTASGNTGKLRLAVYPDYPDGATAKGKVMEVDGNTGVFAIPITGTPYENLTADQINAMIGSYWEGLKGTREVGVKAIGKNLFDKNDKDNLANYYLSETGSIDSSGTNFYSMTGFVKVKPSSSYRQNISAYSFVYACYYDRNKNLISSQALSNGQITLNTPINCQYLRTTFINSYGTFDTLQIEEGTVLTPYEPYTETELFAPVKLNRLPNNIADEFTMDGKYIQRTAEKTSQTGVVNYADMATDGSFIAQLADGTIQTGVKGETLTATATKIIYQLATPIETQYPSANLIAEASGSIYVDSTYSNAQYYDTGITVSGRKFSSINKVTLIDKVSGAEKDITSQCTLNVNKDGFTATGVLPTDLIWYSLELADAGILPTLSYSYSLNIAGAVSSNTESIKQIDERTDMIQSIVESQNYMYGDPVSEFENFDPINAQFLGGNAPEYYAAATGLNAKIDKESIINDLTTGGITNVLSAEQGKVIGASISQLQTDMSSIDVSWNAITGKPTTFTPSTHIHDYAPNGYGLGGSCITITDVHTINKNGWYMGANVANAPDANWWTYKATVHNDAWVEIEATPFTNGSPHTTKRVKYKQNGVWGGWINFTIRNIIISTADPTLASMAVGDIWIKV